MLDIDAIGESIRTWIESVTGLSCIYSEGSGPRPKGSYLTLNVLNTTAWGDGEYETVAQPDYSIDFNHSIIHDIMVSINAYRDGAFVELSKLVSSLDHIATLDYFMAAGIGIGRHSEVRDVPEVVGAKWEQRAQIDLFFNVRSASTENIEGIKQVEVTNEIDGTTAIIKHPDLP